MSRRRNRIVTFKHKDIIRLKYNHAKVGMVDTKFDEIVPGYVYVHWFPYANRVKLIQEDEIEVMHDETP